MNSGVASTTKPDCSPTRPRPSVRDPAIDYLRSFIVGLVVVHHAALAYCTFAYRDPANYLRSSWPVVDPRRWVLMDVLVAFNDTFFMSLMFFISGWFVWRSLRRKGTSAFVRDRAMRLGVPFLLGVLFVIPFGYYPGWLAVGHDAPVLSFWRQFLFTDGWPSGPLWFLWLLLAFNLITVVLVLGFPSSIPGASAALSHLRDRPVWLLVSVFSVGAGSYLPLRLVFGAEHWISFGGPLSVMGDRLGLYAAAYGYGMVLGSIENGAKPDAPNPGIRHWWLWLALGLVIFAGIQLPILKFGRMGSLPLPSPKGQVIYGSLFLIVCLLIGTGLFVAFRKFIRHPIWLADRFSEDAFGIYVLHFPLVLWLQYLLLQQPTLGVLSKFAVTAGGAIMLSWAATRMLRSLPGVKRIL